MKNTLNSRRFDMQYTSTMSVSRHVVALMLCLSLGFERAAAANSDKMTEIWKGLDEFVVLAAQDAPPGAAAPRNDQPVVIAPAILTSTLAKLRVHEGKGEQEGVPLFEADAARRLAAPLSRALERAAADQDVLFAIDMSQRAALLGSKPVSVAGR